jgi:hypothetical protein
MTVSVVVMLAEFDVRGVIDATRCPGTFPAMIVSPASTIAGSPL